MLPTEEEVSAAKAELDRLSEVLNNVLFGQPELVQRSLIGVLAGGHMLLEGLPGLGKTQLVKGLAVALGLNSKRIQFTPDLLPTDVTGTALLNDGPQGRRFEFQPGPLFANLVLADEINRASPRTQSALLEAMQERQVTVLGQTHTLPDPFFVIATQNPIELEGTYPLPEAQLDRFLFKLQVVRGDVASLEQIIKHREIGKDPEIARVLDKDGLLALLELVRRVHLPQPIVSYIARLVDGSHPGRSKAAEGVRYGASPRAGLGLAAAAKARALMQGRLHVGFEDVQALASAVMGHRLVLDYSARMKGRSGEDVARDLVHEVSIEGHGLPPTLSAESVS